MISNQILQNTIDGLKGITKIDLSVMDTEGNVLAETAADGLNYGDSIRAFVDSPADSQVIGTHHLLKILDESEQLYVLDARGIGEDTYMIGKIAVSQLQNLIIAYKEKYDRNNFFQNLICKLSRIGTVCLVFHVRFIYNYINRDLRILRRRTSDKGYKIFFL